ncbi:hypothetical protein PInf_004350 [Phytophthora infestans]|nr:hypothetical protein PInf_004350 [Phytophthora infestans]
MPPAKRHATTSSRLSIPLGAPEPPVNSPVIPPAQSPARTPAQSPAKTPAKSPATTPAKSPAKTPAKAPAKSPRKTPTKSAEKTSAKSPANTPAKSPAKPSAQAPAKGQTPRKKRARKEVAASPIPSLRPLRSCTVRAAEVDISVGDDRLSSGDEDDFQVDEGDESDIEGTSETSAGEEEENTSNEEDAVDLSAGTPFDQMNKDQLSEHAKTGWTTYFEDSCASLQLPSAELTRCSATPTEAEIYQVSVFRTTRGKNGTYSKKRRQYGCKVCSLLRPGKSPWVTTFFCVECSERQRPHTEILQAEKSLVQTPQTDTPLVQTAYTHELRHLSKQDLLVKLASIAKHNHKTNKTIYHSYRGATSMPLSSKVREDLERLADMKASTADISRYFSDKLDMVLISQQTRSILQEVLGSTTVERTRVLLDAFVEEDNNDVLLVQDQMGHNYAAIAVKDMLRAVGRQFGNGLDARAIQMSFDLELAEFTKVSKKECPELLEYFAANRKMCVSMWTNHLPAMTVHERWDMMAMVELEKGFRDGISSLQAVEVSMKVAGPAYEHDGLTQKKE